MKVNETANFLLTLSSHLSGRVDCKGVNYEVVISETGSVHMYPAVSVFPDRYRRKDSDKVSVIDHVLLDHFPHLYMNKHITGVTYLWPTKVIPGTYEYQSSFDNKRRRWKRIK